MGLGASRAIEYFHPVYMRHDTDVEAWPENRKPTLILFSQFGVSVEKFSSALGKRPKTPADSRCYWGMP